MEALTDGQPKDIMPPLHLLVVDVGVKIIYLFGIKILSIYLNLIL